MSLVAYWPLNETSGDAIDIRGGNDGTVNGATQGVEGLLGETAYEFDGSNDEIDTGTVIIPDSSNPYTVSVWCKRDRNNAEYEELLSQWSSATSNNSFFFGFDGGDMRFTDDWNSVSVDGAEVVGEWIHLVGVHTTSDAFIYLNSEVKAQRGSGFSYTGTDSFVIGQQGENDSEYFDGSICEVRAYDHALTPSEVQYLYEVSEVGQQTGRKETL